MAASWYGFRHWPLLRQELEELSTQWSGGNLVNLGCGHGADFIPFIAAFQLTGLDFSRGMLSQGRRYMAKHGFNARLVQGDLTDLPFADGSFDHAIAVASYHHIEGEAARARAFAELHRVLRPGGEAFLSVWRNPSGAADATPEDQLVPWRSGDTVLQRYYHFFTPTELHMLLTHAGLTVMRLEPNRGRAREKSGTQANLCALAIRRDAEPSPIFTTESEERG